jgi:hypothetical protein
MTIDERLDQLAERHAALTQTVELMAHMHQADYKRHEEDYRRHEETQRRNEEAQRRNEEAQRRNEENMAKNQTLIAQIMESITSLARIAQAHENRISGLESL